MSCGRNKMNSVQTMKRLMITKCLYHIIQKAESGDHAYLLLHREAMGGVPTPRYIGCSKRRGLGTPPIIFFIILLFLLVLTLVLLRFLRLELLLDFPVLLESVLVKLLSFHHVSFYLNVSLQLHFQDLVIRLFQST